MPSILPRRATKDHPLTLRASHVARALDSFLAIQHDVQELGERLDFDTIVGTGVSGALVVPRLGPPLGRHWALVRKPDVATHSFAPYEGRIGARWLLVDDLVNTGRTVDRVRDAVDRAFDAYGDGLETTYVGAYLYDTHQVLTPPADPWLDAYVRAARRALYGGRLEELRERVERCPTCDQSWPSEPDHVVARTDLGEYFVLVDCAGNPTLDAVELGLPPYTV